MTKIFETRFAGLTLPNPIIVGSSGLTNTAEKNLELEKAGAGAIVLKSLFEEQILKQGEQLLNSAGYPEAEDYILHYVRDYAIENYLQLIRDSKEACKIPIVASVNCYRDDSWIDFASEIEKAGADAIELNIFALNTEPTDDARSLEEAYLRITRKIKEKVGLPIIVKMGKYFSQLVKLVDQLHGNGVDGMVLFNRFYQPDIDINSLQITSGNLFSSSADMGDTLRWTSIVTGRLPQASIAASTGVHDWEDLVKCLLSGASAVQICSTLYQNGNETIAAMKRGLEEWMIHNGFHSINDFKGKLNTAHIADPSLYERVQFMRYFSNRD